MNLKKSPQAVRSNIVTASGSTTQSLNQNPSSQKRLQIATTSGPQKELKKYNITLDEGFDGVVMTEENYICIKQKIEKNDPMIVSLEIAFPLSKEKLEGLNQAIKANNELGYIRWHSDQEMSILSNLIDSKLISNNKNYRYYPTDYIHALLSAHAYIDSQVGETVILTELSLKNSVNLELKDWKVIAVHNDTECSGYYGVIYQNCKKHQIVLATRGTEGGPKGILSDAGKFKSDWNTNLKETLVGAIVIGQQARNYEAAHQAVKLAKENAYRLSFTGHSLGAWLAELNVFYCYAYFDHLMVKAVTFDSPGALPMMEQLQSNIKSNCTQIDLNTLGITTYLAMPNLVNSCNSHVGKVYRIAPEMEWSNWVNNKLPGFIKNKIGNKIDGILACEGHTLIGILEVFDSETGKPRSYQRMADWPRMKYTGNAKDFSSARNKLSVTLINGLGVPKIIAMLGVKIVDYIVKDHTLVTMVDFLLNLSKVDQKQYWVYHEYKDQQVVNIQKANTALRQKLQFDNQFTLIAQGKYRPSKEDIYIMDLATGSTDKFLYKLYDNKKSIEEIDQLPSIIQIQLKELLASFSVRSKGGGVKQFVLMPNQGFDAEGIQQRTHRLLEVFPKHFRKVSLIINKSENKREKNANELRDAELSRKQKANEMLLDTIFQHQLALCEKDKIEELAKRTAESERLKNKSAILNIKGDKNEDVKIKLQALIETWPKHSSNYRIEFLTIDEIGSYVTLNLWNDFSSLKNLNIGDLKNHAKLEMSDDLKLLEDLHVGNIRDKAFIKLPSSLNKLKRLILQDIDTESIQFPVDVPDLETIIIGKINDGIKFIMPKLLNRLKEFKIKEIGCKAEISLPQFLNNLTNLEIEKIKRGALFELPILLNNLISFKLQYIEASTHFKLRSTCNRLEKLEISKIKSAGSFELTGSCNNLQVLIIKKVYRGARVDVSVPLNSLTTLEIESIEEEARVKLPDLLPNLKTIKYQYSQDKRKIQERLPLIFLKFKLDIINLPPNFCVAFLFLIYAAYYLLG